MNWSDIGKTVAEFAPLLGGVVGGPAGAGIGAIIATAFGVEDKPSEVMKAIKSSPEAALKLQEIQLTHKATLEEIALETTKSYLKDRQQARVIHQHSKMPAIIVSALTIGLFAFIAVMMFHEVPESNIRIIDTIFGSYITAWLGALGYWNGTTRSSADKSINGAK